ncbi:MAG TPA: DNA adenine methylase [Chitinophagales bacterium]|nr:DNA adenine methylase [Chitinophagales bacterium]
MRFLQMLLKKESDRIKNAAMQADIFDNTKLAVPETEGIKYTGSKLKMLPYIVDIISELEVKKVLDGFSGTTRVSQAFAQLGFDTTSNDIAVWSETFGKCYLLNDKPKKHYQELINHLNSLRGYDGWFTQHYGGDVNEAGKKPFQRKNTQKLDAVRDEIDKLNLTEIEKAVALTSLVLALDAVDSTLGHYAAYLSEWSPRSCNDMILKVPNLFVSAGRNTVIKADIFETVRKHEFDLAYFDPPYGSNNDKMPPSRVRYSSYYHIWTTIILNDKPGLFGKANRREDSRDQIASSVFEEFRKDGEGKFIAMQAIRKLIRETNAKFILLSYSSGGRAAKEELMDIITSNGELLKAVEVDYKHNVMATLRWTNEWINSDRRHVEYLFLMKK